MDRGFGTPTNFGIAPAPYADHQFAKVAALIHRSITRATEHVD